MEGSQGLPLHSGRCDSAYEGEGNRKAINVCKIVQTLLQRGYVIETKGKKKLVPTEKGIKVYQYLITKYKDLVSEERTRQLEKIMDMVEEAKADYQDVLNELYEEIKRYVR